MRAVYIAGRQGVVVKAPGIETLTERQKEILRLISQHLQAKEVARALNISERTVKTHTDAARKRLGVTSSRDAARLLAAHESANPASPPVPSPPVPSPLLPKGRWPSRPIGEPADGMSISAHEQTPHPAPASDRPARDGALERSGDGVADAGDAGQAGAGDRDGRRGAGTQLVGDLGEGSVHNDRGNRLVDRRWAGFERRLAALNAIQWLGLIAIVGVLAAVLVGGLIAASLGTMEAIEDMHRQIG